MSAIDRDWGESVEMNGVGDDGRTGFSVRLARFPGQGRAWLWVVVLLPGPIFGYGDESLPLSGFQGVTDIEADSAVYELTHPSARFERRGARAAMSLGTLAVEARAHRTNHPRVGPGAAPLRIEATFRAGHAPNTRGQGTRTEVLGTVEATLSTPAGTLTFAGRGHWHEQHGPRPHFAAPFTYFTLRGEHFGFVGTRTERGAGGFAARESTVTPITAIEVEPPGSRRAFRLTLADGSEIAGTASAVHAFSVAIEGQRRPGTIVVADTPLGSLSGMINDWRPA